MLYIKYLIRDYEDQNPETRIDLFMGIKAGYEQEYLSKKQVYMICLYSKGYQIERIAALLKTNVTEAKTLLCAAFSYLETALGYYDRSVIYSYKKEVKPEWLLKCQVTALEEWEDE